MADRFHSEENGVWRGAAEDAGTTFKEEDIVDIALEKTKEDFFFIKVSLKDGSTICPDYTGYDDFEDAKINFNWWCSVFNLEGKKIKNAIKPIETIYKGYKFRSRLEARWAVFLDAIGVEWEYEPEGFDLGDGIYYLPDFYLPNAGTRLCRTKGLWIEVKGKMTPEDEEKIIRFSGAKNHDQYGKMDHSIYIVGNIPKGITFADLIADMENICYEGRAPFYNFEYVDGDYFGAFPCANKEGKFELLGDDCNYLSDADEKKTVSAFLAARQARFEHGEQGYTNNN